MHVKQISLNIRFANPKDGDRDWPYRRPRIAEYLKEVEPDILGTQEGRRAQIEQLHHDAQELGLVMIDQHRDWIDRRMYPTFFLRTDRFEVLESGDLWLSETPDIAESKFACSAFPRLMTWARVVDRHPAFGSRQNPHCALIVNTHLDHLNESTRLKQVEVLVREIRRLTAKWRANDPVRGQSPHAIIIGGDFNSPPHGQVRQHLLEGLSELHDPWLKLGLPERPSHHSFSEPKRPVGQRIDWLLYPRDLQVEHINLHEPKERAPLSDHLALQCTWRWPS